MTERRSKSVALFHDALSKPDKRKEWDFYVRLINHSCLLLSD